MQQKQEFRFENEVHNTPKRKVKKPIVESDMKQPPVRSRTPSPNGKASVSNKKRSDKLRDLESERKSKLQQEKKKQSADMMSKSFLINVTPQRAVARNHMRQQVSK